MTCSKKIIIPILFLALIPCKMTIAMQDLKTWDVFEITLKSSATFKNPYTESLKTGEKAYVTALFIGTEGSCAGKKITTPGFWDGEDVWKIRFAGNGWGRESSLLDLRNYPESTRFTFQWTDLVNNNDSRSGTINGGRISEIKCPEDYPGNVNFKDWILYIKQAAN
jgi:hypothetical protein